MKVIIVGCGIAGLSAGIWFQKNGYDTTILEKNFKKETKLCGGLITKKVLNELDLLNVEYEDIIFKPMTININDEDNKLISFNNTGEVFLTYREEFDLRLIEKYLEVGGKIIFGKKIIDINSSKKHVVSNEGNVFEYDILIIANGANTKFRGKMTLSPIVNAVCLERKLQREENLDDLSLEKESNININFIRDKIGYSWVFENKDKVIEGVGFLNNSKDIKLEFGRIFNSTENTKGALVPFGKQPMQIKAYDIYFIGDAGGYVNPLLAEGISYSIASGRAAYESVHYNSLETDNILRKSIKSFLRLRNIFYSKLNRFLKLAIKKHPNFAEYYCKKIILSEDFNEVGFINLISIYIKYRTKKGV